MSHYEPYAPGRPGPESSAEPEHVPSGAPARRGWGPCSGKVDGEVFAIASVVSIVVWVMAGGGYFWPMWVLLGTGVPVVMQQRWSRRRPLAGKERHP